MYIRVNNLQARDDSEFTHAIGFKYWRMIARLRDSSVLNEEYKTLSHSLDITPGCLLLPRSPHLYHPTQENMIENRDGPWMYSSEIRDELWTTY